MTADPNLTRRLQQLAETWRRGEWVQDPLLIGETIRYIGDLEDQNAHLAGAYEELRRAEALLERYEQKATIARSGQ